MILETYQVLYNTATSPRPFNTIGRFNEATLISASQRDGWIQVLILKKMENWTIFTVSEQQQHRRKCKVAPILRGKRAHEWVEGCSGKCQPHPLSIPCSCPPLLLLDWELEGSGLVRLLHLWRHDFFACDSILWILQIILLRTMAGWQPLFARPSCK